jgi:5-formyltetrahydrofolate cyclo-ligase
VAGQLTAVSPKTALRREVLAARDAQDAAVRAAASARIAARLLSLEAWKNARCVLLYLSFGSEFDTAVLLADAAVAGRQLCLPRVDRDARRITIHRVTDPAREVQTGVWGIREPRADRPAAELNAIDFVLVPGVAFTPRCERLGYGGGYYDGLIGCFEMRPPLVAAAFELQMRDAIPLSDRDQRVDLVVTESAAYCGC